MLHNCAFKKVKLVFKKQQSLIHCVIVYLSAFGLDWNLMLKLLFDFFPLSLGSTTFHRKTIGQVDLEQKCWFLYWKKLAGVEKLIMTSNANGKVKSWPNVASTKCPSTESRGSQTRWNLLCFENGYFWFGNSKLCSLIHSVEKFSPIIIVCRKKNLPIKAKVKPWWNLGNIYKARTWVRVRGRLQSKSI